MNVKIDTKEKFTVITPDEQDLPAIMTADLNNLLLSYLEKDIPHIVFNMHVVKVADEKVCEMLAVTQHQFYEKNVSFVICNMSPAVENILKEKDLLEMMNVTLSESEAWDIVQMEEIERELLGGKWD